MSSGTLDLWIMACASYRMCAANLDDRATRLMQLFALTRGYRFDPARRFALGLLARNGAAILAVPRLNLLARPVAATKVEGSAGRVRSAFSFRRSASEPRR